MPKHTDRVLLEEVDWPAVLPWLRLFRCFRMAMHPAKLMVALALITSLFITGKVMDIVWGDEVAPGEIDQYRQVRYGLQSQAEFDRWLASREQASRDGVSAVLRGIKGFQPDIDNIAGQKDPFDAAQAAIHLHYVQLYKDSHLGRGTFKGDASAEALGQSIRDERRARLAAIEELRPRGTFHTALQFKLDALNRLARGAVTFNFGWSELASRQGRHSSSASRPAPAPSETGDLPGIIVTGGADFTVYQDQTTVIAAVRDLIFIMPGWLWSQHRAFLMVYVFVALIFFAILGGALARLCALEATRHDSPSIRQSLRFSSARAWSFFIAPIAPIGIIFAVGLLMMVGGFVLFSPSRMGVDIIGGLLFIVSILCAAIITMTIVLSAAGLPMVYPAIAVEGADLFDGLARAFNCVLNRPWRWFIYNFIALLYGALTYMFVAFVLVLLVNVVHEFVGVWVVTQTDLGVNRFDVIFPSPKGSGLSYTADYQMLDWSGRIAAMFVRFWMFFTIAITLAYAITFFFSAQTWIYLLLRKSADGVGFEDVYLEEPVGEPQESTAAMVPDKMESDLEGPPEADSQSSQPSDSSGGDST